LNRLSLRARLLIGLVALVAIGLGAAAIATYEEQRSFLFRRVDQQVVASELPVSVGMGLVKPRGPTLTRQPPLPPHRAGLPARPEATFQASGTYGELLDGGGRVLRIQSFTYGGTAASPPALPTGRFPVSRTTASGVHLFTVHSRSGSGLRYRAAGFSVGQDRVLVIAVPLRDVDQTLHRLIVVEGLVGGALIIALVALGWMVIRLGLRPLERIERVASDISHGDLSRRVSSANPRTEVGRLGASLNEMLVQIERAFADRTESEDRLRRHEPIIEDRALFERVQRRTVSRGRQAKSDRLLARLGVLRCGTCKSRMVINSYSGNYRCGDTSANRCRRRAAVKADRVEEMVLDAVRAYSATTDADGRASRKQQIREADEAIERANADLDATIRQLGELGLLGRPASQETLEKLT
jgi:HAMP domain-containing protein